MQDNEMPGATLEAPDTFQVLSAPLWPRLPLGFGLYWRSAMGRLLYRTR